MTTFTSGNGRPVRHSSDYVEFVVYEHEGAITYFRGEYKDGADNEWSFVGNTWRMTVPVIVNVKGKQVFFPSAGIYLNFAALKEIPYHHD